MKYVSTIGELIVDFLPEDNNPGVYRRKMGGAPANVVATVAKLGGKAAFYGMVGRDTFGDFVIDELRKTGVDVSYIARTDQAKTGLAFVELDADGNRSFEFYRNPSADMLYTDDDFLANNGNHPLIAYSSISLVSEPMRTTVLAAMNHAKQNSGITIFDVNIRPNLWKDHDAYREIVHEYISLTDIIKLSEEDLMWLTRSQDMDEAIFKIMTFKPLMLIVTKGRKGSEIHIRNQVIEVYGYRVEAVDTTGAGDAFLGAFLYQLSLMEEYHFLKIPDDMLAEMLRFSNAVAAISTTKKGAIEALPTIEEVEIFMATH